jgi:hypothetical protein
MSGLSLVVDDESRPIAIVGLFLRSFSIQNTKIKYTILPLFPLIENLPD